MQELGRIGSYTARNGKPVTSHGRSPGLRHPWAVVGSRRYLRDTGPTIVHTFLLTASLYGRLAALLARVRIVVGTEVNIYEHKQRGHAWAERLLMAGTDAVIVSAASVKTFYQQQGHADPAQVTVIDNAVDFSQAIVPVPRARRRDACISINATRPCTSGSCGASSATIRPSRSASSHNVGRIQSSPAVAA